MMNWFALCNPGILTFFRMKQESVKALYIRVTVG
jgi:hypothetical protein